MKFSRYSFFKQSFENFKHVETIHYLYPTLTNPTSAITCHISSKFFAPLLKLHISIFNTLSPFRIAKMYMSMCSSVRHGKSTSGHNVK